jgi:hypothetical protein
VGNGWSEGLGGLITKQIGAEAAAAVKRLLEENKDLKTDGAFAAALMKSGIPKTLWPAAFDLFTAGDDLYVPGRVDLNSAPVKVLAAVPGIGEERAAAIVAAREQLSTEERKSRVWPLTRDIMKPEEMAQAVEWLTTRSMQWRVRVRASIERTGTTGEAAGSAESGSTELARAMEKRVVRQARAIAEAAPPAPPPPPPPVEVTPEPVDVPPPGGDSPPAPPADDKAAAGGPAGEASGDVGAMVDRRTGRWNAGGSRGRSR